MNLNSLQKSLSFIESKIKKSPRLILSQGLALVHLPIIYQTYIEIAEEIPHDLDISLQKGALFVNKGPSYETAAEIRMIKTLGDDAVTTSAVLEVIAEHQKGIRMLGISCITNMATGSSDSKLYHEEVTIMADKIRDKFIRLIT